MSNSQVQTALQEFAEASYPVYGNFNYAAGYFQSLAAEVIAELPAARQQQILEQLRSGTANLGSKK